MSNNLDEIRIKINQCDLKLIEAFKERMNLVKEVALYKKANNLPIFDKNREKLIKEKNIKLLNDKEIEEYFINFFENLLIESKKYQKRIIDDEK